MKKYTEYGQETLQTSWKNKQGKNKEIMRMDKKIKQDILTLQQNPIKGP